MSDTDGSLGVPDQDSLPEPPPGAPPGRDPRALPAASPAVRRLLLTGVVGAGAGLLVSALVTVLAALGSGSLLPDAGPGRGLDLGSPVLGGAGSGLGDLLAVPVLLCAAAWGGSVRLATDGGLAGLAVSVTYVPLGVTVFGAAALAAVSWRDERRLRRPEPGGVWVRAAVTGLVHAGVVAVLATLVTVTAGTAVGGGTLTMRAGLPRLLLVGSLLSVAASALGRATALPATIRCQAVPRRLRPAVPALDVVAVHSVTAVLLVAPAVTIAALVASGEPLATVLTGPLWLVNAAAGVTVLGHGGGLAVSSSTAALGDESRSETWGLLTPGSPVLPWLAVPLVAVSALVAARRVAWWRDGGAPDLPRWAVPVALPAAWLIGSWLLLDISLRGEATLLGLTGVGSASMTLTLWTLPVLAAWGGLVELLAARLPDRLRRVPAAVARLAARHSPGTAPPAPEARRTRAAVAAVASLLVLLAGAAIAVSLLNGRVYSPDARVRAYLAALSEGRASQALRVADVDVPAGDRVLLTDGVLGRATGRPDAIEILEVERAGDVATVTARFDVAGDKVTQVFTLHRVGRRQLVLDSWVLDPPALPVLSVATNASPVIVNGTSVDLADGSRELPVFPGTYTLGVDPDDEGIAGFLTAEPVQVTAASAEDTPVRASLEAVPTDAMVAQVQQQVNRWIDECAATDPPGEGCPFSRWGTYVDAAWRVDRYPTIALAPSRWPGDVNVWDVSTTRAGQVTFTGTRTGTLWSDERVEDTQEVRVGGSVTLAGRVVYERSRS